MGEHLARRPLRDEAARIHAHRAAFMNAGRLVAAGPTREVLKERAVIEAYLGSGSDA